MPEIYRIPGVTFQHSTATQRTIVGVPTSTALVIGAFPNGRAYTPTQIQSIRECERAFGGLTQNNLCSLVTSQFFTNGGKELWIISTGPKSSLSATPLLKGLSLVRKLQSVNSLLLPETVQLQDHEAAKVFATAILVSERQGMIYLLDLPKTAYRYQRVKDVAAWVRAQQGIQHSNVAVYFPFIQVQSVNSKERIAIPASGTVAGLYARTDAARGVWKAPAGTEATLKGVVGLQPLLTTKDLSLLTAVNVNALTQHASLGYLAWGARTLSGRPEWKYVAVRRMALFLEESIQTGLKWVVFEPNDEPLWAQIRQVVESFLQSLFRQGAFQGAKSKDAYFVKCGRDTMTVSDQAAGRVNIIVGFAPLKPAEFIVLRIQQQAQVH